MLCWQVSVDERSDLPGWLRRLLAELDVADRRAEAVAKGLSAVQLNWQPRPGAWSVGQCLEHLRKGNEAMLPALSVALDGRARRPVEEIALGWFTRSFIRKYIAPNPGGTRARAPKKIEPARQVGASVLADFLRTNEAARELARRASNHDVNHIRYKNPFVPLLRFTVGAGLEIISKHEGRHLLQAEDVRQSAGFPD